MYPRLSISFPVNLLPILRTPRGISRLMVLTAALLLVQANGPVAQSAHKGSQHDYEVEGVWSDACPCKVPCPCWATRRANAKRCVNLQVFHIKKGFFEGFDLSGSTFVLAGWPEAEYGTPDLYRVYTDEKFARIPTAALFSRVFFLPPERGTETVSLMKAEISDRTHSVRIPGLLVYEVGPHQPDGDEPLSITLESNLYPWVRNPRQWRTTKLEYKLGADNVTYAGTNSLVGQFKMSFHDTSSSSAFDPYRPNSAESSRLRESPRIESHFSERGPVCLMSESRGHE